jgi:hypothetical protein
LRKQGTEGDEGLDAQAWLWSIAHLSAGERIEHPRGDRNL